MKGKRKEEEEWKRETTEAGMKKHKGASPPLNRVNERTNAADAFLRQRTRRATCIVRRPALVSQSLVSFREPAN